MITPLINTSVFLNKSGLVAKDEFFSSFMPQEGITVAFMLADASTWIRLLAYDGRVYPFYLPDGVLIQIAITPEQLSSTKILSAGNDWQGNPLPAPDVPSANIRWFGN